MKQGAFLVALHSITAFVVSEHTVYCELYVGTKMDSLYSKLHGYANHPSTIITHLLLIYYRSTSDSRETGTQLFDNIQVLHSQSIDLASTSEISRSVRG